MRTTSQSRKGLPAFSVTLRDIVTLINELKRQMFNPNEEIHVSVGLQRNGEEYKYESLADLMNAPDVGSRYHSVSIWVNGSKGSVYIGTEYKWVGGMGFVSVTGEGRGWCDGVSSVVRHFMTEHRPWYGPVLTWKIGWPFILVSWAGVGLLWSSSRDVIKIGALTWIGTLVIFGGIAALRLVLPPVTVKPSSSERFMTKYGPALTLLVTILSLLAAVIALILRR